MLSVSNIDVFHGDLQALWNVSFEIKEKEIVAIVGSNGAGKTTTLKTVSGLQRPKCGAITFLGRRIDGAPPSSIVAQGLAHVPEGRYLFPYMSVLENLEMGAYAYEARKRRHETLDWVFQLFPVLKEREKQLAGTLSGGEGQMLAIGRGLMSKPKLLMLDEPSLGLAPRLVLQIFDILMKINEEGVTVLLVEQNVRRALEIAHRGYVLETGRIVREGEGKKLLENEHVKKAFLGI